MEDLRHSNSGRLKSGDVQKLLNLWEGKIKIDDIKVTQRTVHRKRVIYLDVRNKKGAITGKKRKVENYEEVEYSYKSGFDVFAYKVLTGNDKAWQALLDKLYADQRNIVLDDNSLMPSMREKLRSMSNEQLAKLEQELETKLNNK